MYLSTEGEKMLVSGMASILTATTTDPTAIKDDNEDNETTTIIVNINNI
jgi:hypothetical protein